MPRINTITHADCMDFLPRLKRESISLLIADPPYNLGKGSWDTFASQDDFLEFTYRWIDLVLPSIKKNGSLYIFNTPLNSAFIAKYLVEKGLVYRNWITWDKRDGFAGGTRRFVPLQESILYFSKGDSPIFNADDVRIPYASTERIQHAKERGILKNGKRWFPNEKGKLCTDVWHIVSERHKTKENGRVVRQLHATPKPLELIERIVLASSNKGDVVLDCFSGTGTTAVACKRHGRSFVACDSNQAYVEFAKGRLLNVTEVDRGD